MTPATVTLVAAIIALVWAALLGTAYAARFVARWRTAASVAAVTACYLVVAGLALLWLGTGERGQLGVAGMLAPYGAALVLVWASRRRADP